MSNRSSPGRQVTTSPAPVKTSISSTDSCGQPVAEAGRLDAEPGDRAAERDRAQLRHHVRDQAVGQRRVDEVLVGAHALHVGGPRVAVDRDHAVQPGDVEARRRGRRPRAGTGSRSSSPAARARRPGSRRTTPAAARRLSSCASQPRGLTRRNLLACPERSGGSAVGPRSRPATSPRWTTTPAPPRSRSGVEVAARDGVGAGQHDRGLEARASRTRPPSPRRRRAAETCSDGQVDGGGGVGAAVGVADRGALGRAGAGAGGAGERHQLLVLGASQVSSSSSSTLRRRASGDHAAISTVPILLRRPGGLLGLEAQPVRLDVRARDRDPAEVLGHQAADAVDVLLLDVEAEQLVEVVDRVARGHPHRAVVERARPRPRPRRTRR